MARAPSVILTPAEKKLATNRLKDAVKTTAAALAANRKEVAALDKILATETATLKKQHAAAIKIALKAQKTLASEAEKARAAHEQFGIASAPQAKKAVPSSTAA